MPQPKSIPPGKGGKPYGKRSKSLIYNMVRCNRTYYSLLKLQAKFHTFYIMFQAPTPAENPAKFQRITQIPRNSPTQSVNSTKFADFVNLFYIMFQAPASTENSLKFQRIKQNLPNYPANYANSVHFAVN